MELSKALALFFKVPEEGKVKTRLAKTLGKAFAIKVYKHLLKKTICTLENLKGVALFGFYSGKIILEGFSYFNFKKNWKIIPQEGNDLSEKLKVAVELLFALGYEKIVLIGADCPYLTPFYISLAFQKLEEYPVVIGPAKDGGYVLLGLTQNFPNYHILFDGLPFETSELLKETLIRLPEKSFYLLPTLEDVDTFGDLLRYLLKGYLKKKI
ncbi:MAG: TIGR04282 family arsenosugar biosynthesis glycosyltransferase [Caldimicrobium sp.]